MALDRHVDLDVALRYLVDDGPGDAFPRGHGPRGHAGFADWYKAVTNRFFDEVHTVTSVDVTSTRRRHGANVKVVVNWQAKIWNPPAPKSEWLGFDAVPDVGGGRRAPTAARRSRRTSSTRWSRCLVRLRSDGSAVCGQCDPPSHGKSE